MLGIFVTLFISVLMCKVIIYTNKIHSQLSLDSQIDGVQKMHVHSVPRIGGLAIFVSLVYTALYSANLALPWSSFYAGLITSLFFVFLGGLTEDLSKSVTPLIRMGFMFFAILYAVYVSGTMPLIRHLGEYHLNFVLSFDIAAIVVTCFAVIGISNAYNIIDGYNGLSSITSIVNVLSLAYLSYLFGDTTLFFVSLSVVAAIFGFFIFNYPSGKLFLGDGGSYSLGFLISLISLNLVEHYHHHISPFSVLLLVVYPFTETVFSILRRKFIHKTSAMQPDNLHLHQLVFDRCLPTGQPLLWRNSRVMPIMLMFILPQTFLAIFFYKSNLIMLSGIVFYVCFYIYFYLRLAKFKTPRWMIVKSKY